MISDVRRLFICLFYLEHLSISHHFVKSIVPIQASFENTQQTTIIFHQTNQTLYALTKDFTKQVLIATVKAQIRLISTARNARSFIQSLSWITGFCYYLKRKHSYFTSHLNLFHIKYSQFKSKNNKYIEYIRLALKLLRYSFVFDDFCKQVSSIHMQHQSNQLRCFSLSMFFE